MLALWRFFRVCRVAFFESTYTPFSFKKPETYKPTFIWLSKSFVFASCICFCPYLQWGLEFVGIDFMPKFLGSLVGLLSITSLLFVPKTRRFSVGFFVGVLWFYWVGLGLRYFDMSFLIPLGVLFMGFLIGAVFYIGLFCECFLGHFVFLMILSFFMPLGFDWFVLESFLAYSYFGVDKLSFAFMIVAIWVLITFRHYGKLLGVICLVFALDMEAFREKPIVLPFKIKIVQSEVAQDTRYENLEKILDSHFKAIHQAIAEGDELVILPESAFPFVLDDYVSLKRELENLSYSIVIVAGSLRVERFNDTEIYYNSTYAFDKGKVSIIDKVLLVPFGEELPLFLQPLVQKFFSGIGGFTRGSGFGEFEIKGVKFQNAICYEGTSEKIYENYPPFVIVTSNNAWFVPSIEPILQKNLIKYYARLYGSTILHSTNFSPSYIVTPFSDKRVD